MRTLITGANGMLGQALVRRMTPAGHDLDVLATARDDAPRFDEPPVNYARLDITEADGVRALLDDFHPDAVVNCAAMTQVDRCEEERAACRTVNTGAVETLAGACDEVGARLVQVSTDFVFDGENGPYDEDAVPNPVNFYGQAKLDGERAARRAERWAIARTVLVYGLPQDESRSNIVLWIQRALAGGEDVHVVTDQHRTPTYAPDLAAGVAQLVRSESEGVFHLAGPELLSVYNLARRVADAFDLDADLIHPTDSTSLDQPAKRPPRTGFVIEKARRALGYEPRPLDDALRDMRERLERDQ
jgi:dTDP-4-dehydrorhamnose reductase